MKYLSECYTFNLSCLSMAYQQSLLTAASQKTCTISKTVALIVVIDVLYKTYIFMNITKPETNFHLSIPTCVKSKSP